MITKNSVVKIQNFAMNHESRPVKSNPDIAIIDFTSQLLFDVLFTSRMKDVVSLVIFHLRFYLSLYY